MLQCRWVVALVFVMLQAGAAFAQQGAARDTGWREIGVFTCNGDRCTVTCADKSHSAVKSAALVQSEAGSQSVLSLFGADAKLIGSFLLAGQMCHLSEMGFTLMK